MLVNILEIKELHYCLMSQLYNVDNYKSNKAKPEKLEINYGKSNCDFWF